MLSLGYSTTRAAPPTLHILVFHIGIFDCLALNVSNPWTCYCCYYLLSFFRSRSSCRFILKTAPESKCSFVHINMTSEHRNITIILESVWYLMEIVNVCVFTGYLIRIMIWSIRIIPNLLLTFRICTMDAVQTIREESSWYWQKIEYKKHSSIWNREWGRERVILTKHLQCAVKWAPNLKLNILSNIIGQFLLILYQSLSHLYFLRLLRLPAKQTGIVRS